MVSSVDRKLLSIIAGGQAVRRITLAELISKDELVANNNYSKSVSLNTSTPLTNVPCTGFIDVIQLYSAETGSGVVKTPAGTLYFFDADPVVAANAAALKAGGVDHDKLIGLVPVLTDDWESDPNGAMATIVVNIPFDTLSTIFVAFRMDSASEYNSVAGDDETLKIRFLVKATPDTLL